MNIIKDFKIEFTAEEVLSSQGKSKSVSDIIQTATDEAVDLAYQLINPVLLYDWFNVISLEEKHVTLKAKDSGKEKRIFVGPYVNELKEAQEVMIEVHTIGPTLEEKVQALNDSCEMLPAYLLDCAGVVALGKVNVNAHRMIEQVAAEKEWGVGASLSPGSLRGWPVNRQHELCSMLELDQINVQVNNSNLLIPLKSVSSMIGIGPEYTRKKVGSMCHLCNLKDTCWRRKK
jgi:hypothetical protein